MIQGEGGFSLPETALVLVIFGLMTAVATPALTAALSRGRAAAGAREMSMEMARLRSRAITERRIVGMRMTRLPDGYAWRICLDGDGDGLRGPDIAAGIDSCGESRNLWERYEGIDFRLPGVAIPEVPPGQGTLAPSGDPVRFGQSDTISFTPRGTSSTGTLYVGDGRAGLFAVVLYGRTGRIRTWRFDRQGHRWVM